MNSLLAFVRSEPVTVWVGLVQSLITLGVSFGLRLTPEQSGSIITVSGIVFALYARSQVSPKTPPAP